ncbi:MAG: STM4015 family protein [Saezia sp.]
MTINDYTQTFYGYPILNVNVGNAINANTKQAYRIHCEYDDEFSATDRLEKLLEKVPNDKIEALVLGGWLKSYEESPQTFIDKLIANRDKLDNLKAIFIGDMTYEDCEISWIIQGSYKPLLEAFPKLEALTIRGATDLVFDPIDHAHLKELVIQSGGLRFEITDNIAKSSLPALEHLELWLGDDSYGFSGEPAQYKEALSTIISKCPNLRYLGIKNSMIADKLAVILSKEEWIKQLTALDLSMGTLGDEGAQALFNSPYITYLKKLHLEHHFMSNAMMEKMKTLLIEVNVAEQQEEEHYGNEDAYRYVSVSE